MKTRNTLMLAAALAAISPISFYGGATTSSTAPRRPPVRRMPVSSSKEIAEWNAAVDAKRLAKKQRKESA